MSRTGGRDIGMFSIRAVPYQTGLAEMTKAPVANSESDIL